MKKISTIVIISLIFNFLLSTFNFSPAYAAALTSVTDTMSRLKASTLSNHTIQFTTPTGVLAAGTITVTFPSDFAPQDGIDYTDVDVTDDGADLTLAATPSGATWGAAFSGTGNRVLTITSGTGTIAATSVVAIEIGTNATAGVAGDKQITNATTAGSYTISLTCGAADSGSLAVAIATEDQVTSTGSVDPYLVFAVTDGTINFGTLSITIVKTDTAQMTAATNSTSGYSITINGNTLTNSGYTIDAIGGTHAASNPGNEQYGLKIAAAGGSGAAVDPYDDAAEYAFVADTTDQVAAAAGVSATTTYTITYAANISTTTEPGTYTATHTYICTGNF